MTNWERFQKVIRLRERIRFAIQSRGPSAIFDHAVAVRWIAEHDPSGFTQIKVALREAGMLRHEIEDLFGRHQEDCACWKCIMRLNNRILAARAMRLSREEFAEIDDAVA